MIDEGCKKIVAHGDLHGLVPVKGYNGDAHQNVNRQRHQPDSINDRNTLSNAEFLCFRLALCVLVPLRLCVKNRYTCRDALRCRTSLIMPITPIATNSVM